jgi:hypothetical protein
MQALLAKDTRAVGPDERSEDEVAVLEGPDIGAHRLDDTDELVPHAAAGFARLHLVVGPQIAAADPARVTITRASVGSTSRASGTVSTRTSPAPYMTVARMVVTEACRRGRVGRYSRVVEAEHDRGDEHEETDHGDHEEQHRDHAGAE